MSYSVYEFFQENKGYIRFPRQVLTTPVQRQENREVKDINNRGGFHYQPHVAYNKAELYLTCRDTKTRDTDNNNAYSYNNIVIARNDNDGHGFVFHNPVVEAIISREIYEKLYELKAVQGGYYPGEFLRVDLTRLNIFPSFRGNYRNFRDVIDTEQARISALCKVREGARTYFQAIGQLEKKSRGVAGPKPEEQQKILIPVVFKESLYYIERDTPFEPVVPNYMSEYRYEKGKGIRIPEEDFELYGCATLDCVKDVERDGSDYICKLTRGIYRPGTMELIKDLIKSSRETLEVAREQVRIYELFLLERGYSTPAGFRVRWEEKTSLERLEPWQVHQLRLQGVIVKASEETEAATETV